MAVDLAHRVRQEADVAMAEHMLRQYAEDCVEDGTISDEISIVICSMRRATLNKAPQPRVRMLN